ncbi:MAG TPA: S8 family serine peptidase [Caldilineaceae bacterium]|nr:S8 family serine peptidase [Caldilineaceae bacterium]
MSIVLWRQRIVVAALLGFIALLLSVPLGLRAQEVIGQSTPMPPDEPAFTGVPLLQQQPGALDAYRDTPFVPGELLVGFYNGDTRALQQLNQEVQAAAVETLDLRGLDGATGTGNVVGQRIQVPAGEEWAVMERLLADPTVAFAVPNWLVYAAEDKSFSGPSGEPVAAPEVPFPINDPQYDSEQWYLQRINASHAWALAYADDGFGGAFTEVQVAIVDSGIDVNHPEFRNHLLAGKNYVTPGAPPDDDCGHGTHVAGTIGAVANNAVGIAGVAPKVRIDSRKVLSLNVFGECVGSAADVSQAIRDAADAGADIINLSLETPAPNVVMEAAVQYALTQNALLIAASGNLGLTTVSWPARYPEVMAIAATTYNDTHSSYSNSGPEVELAAPGGSDTFLMISTWPGEVFCVYSRTTPSQSDYCKTQGTSMAAALVSGAAATIKSLSPGMSAAEIRQLLRDTAKDLREPVNFVGSGRLDLHAALREILPPVLDFSPTTLARDVFSGTLPYTVTLRLDNPSSTAVDWRAELIAGESFVEFHGAVSNTITSTVSYGDPAYLSFTISPGRLTPGSHAATLRLVELLPDGTQRPHLIDLSLLVWPLQELHRRYFPMILSSTAAVIPEVAYRWETPLRTEDRVSYLLFDNNHIGISLPFTVTLRDQEFHDARIYADGFLRFPDTEAGDSLPNHCLPNLTQPAQAIYAWWANLDPTIAGGRISSFQPTDDRFVVEFDNVSSATGVTPAYRVSFQIVLYRDGDIRLNYRTTPALMADLPNVTVGVEARDGLFYNQVACKDSDQEIGFLPQPRQSLLFEGKGAIY